MGWCEVPSTRQDWQLGWRECLGPMRRYVVYPLHGCKQLISGIQKLHDSTILLTLATLSTHLITDIYTTPTIAPVEDTLLPSLAARNAFLDYAFGEYWKRNKYRVGKLDERSLTAHTGGWVGMGQGGIALFLAESVGLTDITSHFRYRG